MTSGPKNTNQPPEAENLQPGQQSADEGGAEGAESYANIEPDGAENFANINPANE